MILAPMSSAQPHRPPCCPRRRICASRRLQAAHSKTTREPPAVPHWQTERPCRGHAPGPFTPTRDRQRGGSGTPAPPGACCRARPVPGPLGAGSPLGVQLALAFTQASVLQARPALVAIMIAVVLFVAYRCHRLPPLPSALPWEKWKAKDGEGASRWQSLAVSSQVFAQSPSRRDGRRDDRGPHPERTPNFSFPPKKLSGYR